MFEDGPVWRRFFSRTAISAALLCCFAWIPTHAREPLRLPDADEFYQRIITLPGAVIRAEPGGESSGREPPVFDINYVFERRLMNGTEWLEVGSSVEGPAEGWLRANEAQSWAMMLVMQYTSPGQRERVPFFERRNDLSEIVASPDPRQIVAKLISQADAGQSTTPPLVAIEPIEETGTVQFRNRPYVIPVSSYKRAEFFGGEQTTLLEIASLNSQAPPPQEEAPETPLQPIKIGVVFVVDTTISMQPFINRVVQTIGDIYAALKKDNLAEQVSFGLVGYRNNIEGRPALEYVVRVYQPLDPNAPAERIVANVSRIREANVSTHSFKEDSVAGLYTAINEFDWEPYQARLVILVTDAGGLEGESDKDQKAKYPRLGMINIKELANAKGITIVPVHLISPAAERFKDVASARRQYTSLGLTGDENVSKYIAVPGASPAQFGREMVNLSEKLIGSLRQIEAEQSLERRIINEEQSSSADLGGIVENELFNAQMRYIGERKGTSVPTFFRAWAADKDFYNPKRKSLEVRVFLTRNQLNELGLALERVLNQAKAGGVSSGSLFSLLQSLAAATSQDPARFGARFSTIGESGLLPAFLKHLPYKSDILSMSRASWFSLGKSGQEQIIDTLEYKFQAYKDIESKAKDWKDLGAGDRGEQIYPIRLSLLP